MPANLDRRFRPRMTLRQIGILVAFTAVSSAVVMPEARKAGNSPKLLLVGAVELPLVLIPVVAILVRRGPLKLWFVSCLAFVPILALLAFLNYSLFRTKASFPRDDSTLSANLTVIVLCEVTLLACAAFLARGLLPRSCPLCRRPALLRDVSVPRSSHFSTRTEPRSCLACGARFRRQRNGIWVDVDTIPSHRPA